MLVLEARTSPRCVKPIVLPPRRAATELNSNWKVGFFATHVFGGSGAGSKEGSFAVLANLANHFQAWLVLRATSIWN